MFNFLFKHRDKDHVDPLKALATRFEIMAKPFKVHKAYKQFHTSPQPDGAPHIEVHGNSFHYVSCERGQELKRIKSLSEDDVLYLLLENVTFEVAVQHELKNRIEGIDGRSVWFPYQEILMSNISPEWGERLKEKHRKILTKHPFSLNEKQNHQ